MPIASYGIRPGGFAVKPCASVPWAKQKLRPYLTSNPRYVMWLFGHNSEHSTGLPFRRRVCTRTRIDATSPDNLPRSENGSGRPQKPRTRRTADHSESQHKRSDGHSRGGTQPRQIKELRLQTVKSIRNSHRDPRRITLLLTEFCSGMIKISGEKGLTYIQISALSHSTAAVWAAADSELSSLQTEQQQCCCTAQSCLSQLLPKVLKLLPEMDPQAAANILWAFAKCGLHPDALVPGVAADLLHKVADNEEPASAQALGNSVWAVATMQGEEPLFCYTTTR